MKPIVLIIFMILYQETLNDPSNTNTSDVPDTEKFNNLSLEQRRLLLEYMLSRISSDKTPRPAVPPEFDIATKSVERFETCRRTGAISPLAFIDQTDSPERSRKVIKTARISANGTVTVNGDVLYDKEEKLKPIHGVEFRVQDGVLSINDKILFDDIPGSKSTTRTSYFQTGSDTLTVKVFENGMVKCIDDNHNTATF